ncbi:hypothetical protein ISS30_02655 [bacterium]|nr:hypothetical protein [bacterium]
MLFLKENGTKKVLIYQIFIEPKGDIFVTDDRWKQDFLTEIENTFEIIKMESKDYKLLGLPFYNESMKRDFIEVFEKRLFT